MILIVLAVAGNGVGGTPMPARSCRPPRDIRLPKLRPGPLLLALASVLCATAPASRAVTVIGPGLQPPDPLAIIDALDPPDEIYQVISDPCGLVVPGTGCIVPPPLDRVTGIEVRDGAGAGATEAVGHSHVDVVGGTMHGLTLRDTSSALVSASGLDPSKPLLHRVEVYDDASIEYQGGTVWTMLLNGRSRLHHDATLGAGWIQTLYAVDDASIVIDGRYRGIVALSGRSTLLHDGTIDGTISIVDQAHMTLQGGPIATQADSGVVMSGAGSLLMISGRITDNGLQAEGDASIEMLGGTIDGAGVQLAGDASMIWRGGEISRMSLDQLATLIIHGAGFEIDGVPVPLGLVSVTSGLLSGVLESGEAFSVPFTRSLGTQLLLVPEPTTGVLLGLGLALLGGRSSTRRARPGSRSAPP